MVSKIAYAAMGIVILAALSLFALNSGLLSSKGNTVLLQLTDPPHVPDGTQSLTITYSGVQVHVQGDGWINSTASGTVDLLSIINSSSTLASVTVPQNATIDMFRFNITGASITINGTKYAVTVPSRQVLANLLGRVNATGASVLADLSPTIVTIITNDSTPIFVMVPSVRAVITAGFNRSAEREGSVSRINGTVMRDLDRIRSNISITGVTLSTVANVTHVTLKVANDGNRTVSLQHVMVYGNETMAASINVTGGAVERSASTQAPGPIALAVSAEGVYNSVRALADISNGHTHNATENAMAYNAFISYNSITNSLGHYVINSIGNSVTNAIGNSIANAIGHYVTNSVSSHSANSYDINSLISASVAGIKSRIHSGNITLNESALRTAANALGAAGVEINVSEVENTLVGITHDANAVAALRLNITTSNRVANETVIGKRIEAEQMRFRVVNFLVNANATLSLPRSGVLPSSLGYNLTAGNTVTLSYSSRMSLADGRVLLGLVPGIVYQIEVSGTGGASASVNATAG